MCFRQGISVRYLGTVDPVNTIFRSQTVITRRGDLRRLQELRKEARVGEPKPIPQEKLPWFVYLRLQIMHQIWFNAPGSYQIHSNSFMNSHARSLEVT